MDDLARDFHPLGYCESCGKPLWPEDDHFFCDEHLPEFNDGLDEDDEDDEPAGGTDGEA